MTWESLVMWCGGLIAVLTAASLLWKVVLAKPVGEVMDWVRWWGKFQSDWEGQPEGADRKRVPGVMERLNILDGEFRRNGGASLRDQVIETRRDIELIAQRVEVMETRVVDIQHRLSPAERASA
jgi:hypothetical protein